MFGGDDSYASVKYVQHLIEVQIISKIYSAALLSYVKLMYYSTSALSKTFDNSFLNTVFPASDIDITVSIDFYRSKNKIWPHSNRVWSVLPDVLPTTFPYRGVHFFPSK